MTDYKRRKGFYRILVQNNPHETPLYIIQEHSSGSWKTIGYTRDAGEAVDTADKLLDARTINQYGDFEGSVELFME